MTTPRLGAPSLTSGQAVPETTVNEQIRYLESGVGHFVIEDRDLATPPGAPSDGQAYIVAPSPTGAWSGQAGKIAYRLNTAWVFITIQEGFTFWVKDEDKFLVALTGASFQEFSTSAGGAFPLTFNFSDDGEARFYADTAMTLTHQATSGIGTIAYSKSTTAAPDTFNSTTSPITLQAGAWLRVTASGVTTIVAAHLKRTA